MKARYDRAHTLFYLDPPYFGTEGYGVPFEIGEYTALASAMRAMKGNAILSVNDIPEMRAAFAGFRIRRLKITYTVGGSGRSTGPSGELLVTNW